MHLMSTQKRRIVYFTDEAWTALKIAAKLHGQTVSAYIRHNLVYGTGGGSETAVEVALSRPLMNVSRKSDTQNSYMAFRPVPKPGHK
jgi:hypothetical protein